MYSYVTRRAAAACCEQSFLQICQHKGVSGHSMGGHGALTIALKNPAHLYVGFSIRAYR